MRDNWIITEISYNKGSIYEKMTNDEIKEFIKTIDFNCDLSEGHTYRLSGYGLECTVKIPKSC
jgi:hypothetical protein